MESFIYLSLVVVCLALFQSAESIQCSECKDYEREKICQMYNVKKCPRGLQPVPCGCGCFKCASDVGEPCGGYAKLAGECGDGLTCEIGSDASVLFPQGRCVEKSMESGRMHHFQEDIYDMLKMLRSSGFSHELNDDGFEHEEVLGEDTGFGEEESIEDVSEEGHSLEETPSTVSKPTKHADWRKHKELSRKAIETNEIS